MLPSDFYTLRGGPSSPCDHNPLDRPAKTWDTAHCEAQNTHEKVIPIRAHPTQAFPAPTLTYKGSDDLV